MRKGQNPLPTIDLSRCTRCGACAQVCPTGVIAELDALPKLAEPDRCTLCARCEDTCPVGAISVPFMIGWAERL